MQPVSPNTSPVNPPPLPPRGKRRNASGNGTLVSISQSANKPEVGLLYQIISSFSSLFRSVIAESPFPLLILPKDIINYIITHITEDKDLCSLTQTCRTLSAMRTLPHIKIRICLFNVISTVGMELIDALRHTPLNDSETRQLGLSPIQYISPREQRQNAAYLRYAEKIEDKFFALCKKKCPEITVADFHSMADVMLQRLIKIVRSSFHSVADMIHRKFTNQTEYTECLGCPSCCKPIARKFYSKLETVSKNFLEKAYLDSALTYASQPLEKITPISFKAKVAELQAHFPHHSSCDIETCLRQAIKTSHGDGILKLANIYVDPNYPQSITLKMALQTELENSKTASNMTEEQLYEIEVKLAHLDETAQMEAQKISLFYAELDQAVASGQEETRSKALHSIID